MLKLILNPMDTKHLFFILCVIFFTIPLAYADEDEEIDEGPLPEQKPVVIETEQKSESYVWAIESSRRLHYLYPSNWGHVGIFRVRSAESLPQETLTFGIGGEFYSVSNAPTFYGSNSANTIAESLFVGYAPIEHLTLGVMRRNSSTTLGSPQQLISSLGDLYFSGMYSFLLNESMAIAPLVNFLIASNFNDLAPSGNTLSAGLGAAFTFSLYPSIELPLFLHANLLYHMPQIRTSGSTSTVKPETFFNFTRYHSVTLGLGAEYWLGDFTPFIEYYQTVPTGSSLSFTSSPSKISIGTRITPINNKSLAFLLGTDIGVGKGIVGGVPFTPDYQILGQLSYTVGLTQTERKHYYTSQDINIVDRKFIIKKQIMFKVDSAELDPASTGLLDQIAEVIQSNKIKKLLIVGHTDSTASEKHNIKLSHARARTVKNYLVSKGVPSKILLTQGYGKRKPVASNLTEEGRSQNRRVEFYIIE